LKVKSNMDSGMFSNSERSNCCAEQWQILVWFDEWNLQKTPRFDGKLAEKLGCKVYKEGVGLFVWAKLPEGSVSAEKFIRFYKRSLFL
jgi:hypothetical protein